MKTNSEKKKPTWHFLLSFEDGKAENVTVEARDFSAAILSLPRFADAGKYKYKLVSTR